MYASTIPPNFNSTVVQLEANNLPILVDNIQDFNSTVVQLEVVHRKHDEQLQRFQFYCSPIRRISDPLRVTESSYFNSTVVQLEQ